jgi:hypothetical protein
MNSNTHMPAGSAGSNVPAQQQHAQKSSGANSFSCNGTCMENARMLFDRATNAATPLPNNHQDISKRFQFLNEVAATDPHKEAEIMLEHALALYELVYGQEHPLIAELMLRLAEVYTQHGNKDSADYMRTWANDILSTEREEPTHEFFHLFGMDRPEDGATGLAPGQA